jgi:hypothetical protein
MDPKYIKTMDAGLSYFVSQLDVMDTRLNMPLTQFTWSRDIKLRSDVSFANESTSFVRSTFGGVGTQEAQGIPWITPNTNSIPDIAINGERVVTPLRLAARELVYSSIELDRSRLLNQPIDQTKLNALILKWNLETDNYVYIGDSFLGITGLLNSAQVTSALVAADGTGSSTLWSTKTPDQILRDVNEMLTAAWAASGYTVIPNTVGLPPAAMAYIASQRISNTAVSILQYLQQNNIAFQQNGASVTFVPMKRLAGIGAGSTNRMIAYTNEEQYLRFPMVPMRREATYYHSINFHAPYVWAYGEIEFIYPETVIYRDGV